MSYPNFIDDLAKAATNLAHAEQQLWLGMRSGNELSAQWIGPLVHKITGLRLEEQKLWDYLASSLNEPIDSGAAALEPPTDFPPVLFRNSESRLYG